MAINLNTNYSLDTNNLTYLGERNFLLKVAENNGLRLFGEGKGTDSSGLHIHLDSVGRIAIGYGYDLLANQTVAFDELTVAGATINTDKAGLQKAIADYAAGRINLSQLNALISLPSEVVATKLLNNAAGKRELELENFLKANGISITDSRERAVLLSMWYQSPGGDGVHNGYFMDKSGSLTNMVRALQDGNRAEVWYQIRYGSSAGGNGIVVRRYAESEVFGLYSSTTDPVQQLSEAKDAYRTFTMHRSEISSYESRFGIAFDGTLGTTLTKAEDGVMRPPLVAANIRYNLTGDIKVDAIQDELAPAKAAFLTYLSTSADADTKAAYATWSKATDPSSFLSTNLYLDPGRSSSKGTYSTDYSALLDSRRYDANGTEIASNDILIGEGSLSGKGGDMLVGGMGNDLLIGGRVPLGTEPDCAVLLRACPKVNGGKRCPAEHE